MNLTFWRVQWRWLIGLSVAFLAAYYLPVGTPRFNRAIIAALELVKWYAREHVLLCLVPALFIAGAVAIFVNHGTVMKYLGAQANKVMAYLTAAVAGTILAVCSCTILPLFAGIQRRGAGLGPATAFLYSGPAINIMAIVMTARVLGVELGSARAVGAIGMSVLIGLCMQTIFGDEERTLGASTVDTSQPCRPLWQTLLFFGSMIAILVFANWAHPVGSGWLWNYIWRTKWLITALFALILAISLTLFYGLALWQMFAVTLPVVTLALTLPQFPIVAFSAGFLGVAFFTSTAPSGELKNWFDASWDFTKKIMPLLLLGVFVAGLLLGRTDQEGLIPNAWIIGIVGGNSLWANFCASFVGAFMYFATLTEVPIIEGLLSAGMGKGPALTLLLAGPALSLPSILVINSVIGWRKTVTFVFLVVLFSTLGGYLFGLMKG